MKIPYPQRLERVLGHLVQNAFDAMRKKVSSSESKNGSPAYTPKLTVRSKRVDSKIQIDVEDNGPGIPDEIKSKILQPFFTTKKGTQGTGLGLSITNDIIKAHGGELRIESKITEGSTFIVLLPMESPQK